MPVGMCRAPADLEDQAGAAADFDKQGLAAAEQIARKVARSFITCGIQDEGRFGDAVLIQEIVAVAAHVPTSNLPKGHNSFFRYARVKKVGTILYFCAEHPVSKSAWPWPQPQRTLSVAASQSRRGRARDDQWGAVALAFGSVTANEAMMAS